MANIKAFSALKRDMRGHPTMVTSLKSILEPNLDDTGSLGHYHAAFQRLMQEEYFQTDSKPALYIYENYHVNGVQRGIWALTKVNDSTMKNIIQHEQTIIEHQNKIKRYREEVGIEGEPILLTYHSRPDINQLIEQVMTSGQPEYYFHESILHQLWKVTSTSAIAAIEYAFSTVDKLYVADGHHRLAAALSLQHQSEQWVSTLYISKDQLRIKEFNRLIITETDIEVQKLFELLYKYFTVIASIDNLPYRPDDHHEMGMCLAGNWYQLVLKSDQFTMQQKVDAVILQDYILEPFFKITDPRHDPRLETLDPITGWAKLITGIKEYPFAVAFTLFPMTADQLIACADQQETLPPKSTWIEPKIPYGLLLYYAQPVETKGITS